MARPIDPDSAYHVVPHVVGGVVYASVLRPGKGKDGREIRSHWHIGRLETGRFVPEGEFLDLPKEEIEKFVFPAGWSLGAPEEPAEPDGMAPSEEEEDEVFEGDDADLSGGVRRQLYGDVWLLERIAERLDIRRDLEEAFYGDRRKVDGILTLAFHSYLVGDDLDRVRGWQDLEKTPCASRLTRRAIASLLRSVSDSQRRRFSAARAARDGLRLFYGLVATLPEREEDFRRDIDLPTASRERVLAVYSQDGRGPVYCKVFAGWRRFPELGDALRSELDGAGFAETPLVAEMDCVLPPGTLPEARSGRPMLLAVPVDAEFIRKRIRALGPGIVCPDGMNVDPDTETAWLRDGFDPGLPAKRKRKPTMRLDLFLDLRLRLEILLRQRLMMENDRRILERCLEDGTPPTDFETGEDGVDRRRPVSGYYRIDYDEDTWQMRSYALDEERAAEERLTAGFRACVSQGVDLAPLDACRVLGLHRDLETDLDRISDEVERWDEDGREQAGRELVLTVALILASHARQVMEGRLGKEYSSPLDLFEEMQSILYAKRPGRRGRIERFSERQVEICQEFDVEPPEGCEPWNESEDCRAGRVTHPGRRG